MPSLAVPRIKNHQNRARVLAALKLPRASTALHSNHRGCSRALVALIFSRASTFLPINHRRRDGAFAALHAQRASFSGVSIALEPWTLKSPSIRFPRVRFRLGVAALDYPPFSQEYAMLVSLQ